MTAVSDAATVASRLRAIEGVGRDRRRGGYSRHVFTTAERELREWFAERAAACGLDVEPDGNGNVWAWWHPCPRGDAPAVVTGSHLDSVPGGGAFDGPLGVISALCAVERLRASGFRPARPLAVVAFAEEEGGRFGVPCLGSRLLTGAIEPGSALRLTDGDGDTLADVAARAGLRPERMGPDADLLARIGVFVELHVEQGRGLVDLDSPVALGTSIDPHGRWRLSITGRGDHAGSAALADRRDPMVPAAHAVVAARQAARAASHDGARATVGRLEPSPGGSNAIASRVDVWLDARSADGNVVRQVVAEVCAAAGRSAEQEGCELEVFAESWSEATRFDPLLRARMRGILGDLPELATGAGHDAGVLAAHVPAGMLYVRNPTGISHAPAEHAEPEDCESGVEALTRVLSELAGSTGADGADGTGGNGSW
ncbi:allantoate amidohydrolase [Haloechinothrix sp. LS1_15]|uniref:allantoate amidohydrolase n=1 Tax=Haloechinothrix sp. LS1_15 TaxID=2652248 RepID=UPI0029464C41|nr:allantoate amidohydrolase [Haloechinothrix sp. LS1_15]MDV6014564.1 allantoate amidohydrolase [Haloechinothrix sp. LS1_15]